MSIDDDIREAIREVPLKELQDDWQARVDYFRQEYANALKQHDKLTRDVHGRGHTLRAWYDPNNNTYFYEKRITPTQELIDRTVGVREEE